MQRMMHRGKQRESLEQSATSSITIEWVEKWLLQAAEREKERNWICVRVFMGLGDEASFRGDLLSSDRCIRGRSQKPVLLAGWTVKVVVPVTPLWVAEIVELPALTPVASPAELMVANAVFAEAQVT
jgi:hypothetical protein